MANSSGAAKRQEEAYEISSDPDAGNDGTVKPLRIVTSSYRGVSGVRWHSEFPTSKSTGDLASPFRENVERFLAAVAMAGVEYSIAATFRPLERAWLMHWAWKIAHGYDTGAVPDKDCVDIQWVHLDANGNYDAATSRQAAIDLNARYQTRVEPALFSLHISGHAIDVSMAWTDTIFIEDGNGKTVAVPAGTGARSEVMHAVGGTYGVVKRVCDPPHWSIDGR